MDRRCHDLTFNTRLEVRAIRRVDELDSGERRFFRRMAFRHPTWALRRPQAYAVTRVDGTPVTYIALADQVEVGTAVEVETAWDEMQQTFSSVPLEPARPAIHAVERLRAIERS